MGNKTNTDLYSPSSSQVKAAGTIVPKGHADTRDRIQGLEAADGFTDGANIPKSQLTVTHLGETGGRDPVALAQPDGTTVLGSRVSVSLVRGPFLTDIPDAQLLVAGGSHKQGAIGAPRLGLDNITHVQGELRRTRFDIPNLHSVVSRGRCQHVLRRGVEEHVADLPAGGGNKVLVVGTNVAERAVVSYFG